MGKNHKERPHPIGHLTPVARMVVVFGIINFVAFFIGLLAIGGSAVSGKIEDGRYFISSRRGLTEVSYAVYVYSYVHGLSVMVTFPAAIFAGWIGGRAWRNADDDETPVEFVDRVD